MPICAGCYALDSTLRRYHGASVGPGGEVTVTFSHPHNAQFIDTGNAPEYFANGLYDVEVMGPVTRFVLYVERHPPTGETILEPPFTCIMPNEAIGPAIALTMRKLGPALVITPMRDMVRWLMMVLLALPS